MAITQVTEQFGAGNQEATYTAEGRDYTRTFMVEYNATTDYPDAIYADSRIPKEGEAYPTNDRARVFSITPKAEGSGNAAKMVCFVVVKYSTKARLININVANPDSTVNLAYFANPLNKPSQLSWTTTTIQIEDAKADRYSEDGATLLASSVPIDNSAGQVFNPPPVIEKRIRVGVLIRNEPTYNEDTSLAYEDAVNSDVWLNNQPRTVLLKSWTGDFMWESNVFFWRVRYEIWIKSDTWDDLYLDQGLASIVEGSLQTIKDVDGHAVGAPVKLNGSGVIAAQGATAVYRRFNRHRLLPFIPLNIA